MIGEKKGSGLGADVLDQFILNHANWSGAAAREALDELDAVLAIVAHRDGIVDAVVVAMADDAGGGGRSLHDLITAGHGAAQRPANPDVGFARGPLAKHWVEGDQLEN